MFHLLRNRVGSFFLLAAASSMFLIWLLLPVQGASPRNSCACTVGYSIRWVLSGV